MTLVLMAVEACSEIAEGLLLYMSVQLNHLSRSSVKQLNPQLRLWLEFPTSTASESPQRECQVQILTSGLGCYYLDGTSFLNTLCHHGSSFQQCLSSSIISDIQLLCRCIGEHSMVTCCNVNTVVSPPVAEEKVMPRPAHFNPATILLKFKVNLTGEQLTKLLAHLHLMHITSPEITCAVECADSRYSLHLAAESFKQFAKTRMITSLCHFYNNHSSLPVRQSKLRLLKGDAYTIPASVSLTNGSKVTLKVYCTAAVVPHIALRNGRKIPANRLCRYIHISVFGPSHLPLIVAGSMPNFPLASLAEWDSYGMELRQSHLTSESNDHSTVTPSYICEISNTRIRPSTTTPRSNSSVPTNRHLHLFIFLEDTTRDSGLGKNCQWKQSMELHHKLRGMFQSLIVEQSKKFQQAVHSALNKLICNYGSHAKTKSIMATAIPLISDAVTSILKHSTNQLFKERCQEIMEVGAGESGFSGWISERLWKEAKDKLGVTPPTENSTSNPDEPTSPELVMAAGEKSNSESSTETRSAESATQNHVEERNDARTLTSIPPDLSQHETRESSQSGLLQARIASNLTASQKTGIENYDTSEDIDFEALSNFEDTCSQDHSTTSDSDETVISDFDELEGVSEGELSFSDQSQPRSPILLGYTKTNVMHKSPPTLDNADAIPIEPMDTSCEDTCKANFGEVNCYSDEDSTMCSPILVCRDMSSPISSRIHSSSLCTQSVGNGLFAALPDSEYEEQHIPGTHEQAKEPKDEGDNILEFDNDTMSHLSDKEWTELSFQSPVFIQGGSGNAASVGSMQRCNVGTAMCAQRCTPLPTVRHGETHGFTNSTRLQNNSAFDSLEDYEDTLCQCEDETVCVDSLATPASHNGSDTTTCSNTMLTRTCTASPLSTHNITDEDFCWEE